MSSALDFLRFPPLSLWAKARLAFGILYAARIHEGRPLERHLAADWLIRVFGNENYEKMWGPLLKCKLGGCREETSAAFIWTYIARYYSTREKSANQKERLGYVTGGYRTVFNRLIDEIERMGGTIVTGAPVERLLSEDTGTVRAETGAGIFTFDQLITTIPSGRLVNIAPQLPSDYVTQLRAIKSLGIVCFAVLLKRPVTPYYIVNLTDEDLPFTGVIEMSNFVSRSETAGRHLLYLPKYTVPGDPLFTAPEADLWATFEGGLKRICPDIQDSDIEARYLFREPFVQPVPVLGYSDLVPQMQTPLPGLILANTTQIINSNLNNNAMVKIARRAVEQVFEGAHSSNRTAAIPASVPSDSLRPAPTRSPARVMNGTASPAAAVRER
jgi:protoporphyrinogen oxidase